MKKLFVGPWVGEFGWELMMWQGHIRTISKNFNEVIVSSRPGNSYLYKDFCTTFIPHPCEGPTDYELCGGITHNEFLRSYLQLGDTLIPAIKYPTFGAEDFDKFFSKQTFIKFGEKKEELKYDLVIHARYTNKYKTGYRNWNKDSWIKVVEYFKDLKIVTIGKSEGSIHIPGTDNRLDIDLEELSNLLASSKMMIGMSSGPLHLGALCGIKHLVVVPYKELNRFQKWNPFNTPFTLLGDFEWTPPVDYIISSIEKGLNEI